MAKIKISDLAFELGCEGKELRVEFYSTNRQAPRFASGLRESSF